MPFGSPTCLIFLSFPPQKASTAACSSENEKKRPQDGAVTLNVHFGCRLRNERPRPHYTLSNREVEAISPFPIQNGGPRYAFGADNRTSTSEIEDFSPLNKPFFCGCRYGARSHFRRPKLLYLDFRDLIECLLMQEIVPIYTQSQQERVSFFFEKATH